MFLSAKRLSRLARGNSTAESQETLDAIVKMLRASNKINEQLLEAQTEKYAAAIRSGNEQAALQSKKQLDAVSKALELQQTEGARLSQEAAKRQLTDSKQIEQVSKFVSEMHKLSEDLGDALSTNLSEMTKNLSKIVNDSDSDSGSKLKSAKQLAELVGNAGIFDKSPAFKSLLEFTQNTEKLTDKNTDALERLVNAMEKEVSQTDKLNDLIGVIKERQGSEEDQKVALDNILITLKDSGRSLQELDKMKDLINSNLSMGFKLGALMPLLKKVGDQSMQTRTLYTLQQIDKHMDVRGDSLSKGRIGGLTNGGLLGKAGSALANGPGQNLKTSLTQLALAQLGLGNLDAATGNSLSDGVGAAAGTVASAGITAKLMSRGRGAAGAGVKGLAKNALKFGKGKGMLGALLAAGGAAYMMSGSDAQAAAIDPTLAGADGMAMPTGDAPAGSGMGGPGAALLAGGVLASRTGIGKRALAAAGNTIKGYASTAAPAAGAAAGSAGKGILKAAMRAGGKGNALIGAGLGAVQYAMADNTAERKDAVGSTAGGMGGALAGAAAGAALGSVVPILGTAVGGVVGGLIGGFGGSSLGSAVSSWFTKPEDLIPDDVKKQGKIAQAAYIDQMVSSGQYDKDTTKGLLDYQQKLMGDTKAIDAYIKGVAGGNLERLYDVMTNSGIATAHPGIYSAIMNYANDTLASPASLQAAKASDQSIKDSVNNMKAASAITGGASLQPSTDIKSLDVQSKKNITQLQDLPRADQEKVEDAIDTSLASAKADSFNDKGLVAKLMGWVSNVVPTGIYPMVALGVNAINTATADTEGSGVVDKIRGFFGGTKGEPGGTYSGAKPKQIEDIVSGLNGKDVGGLSAHFESGGRGVGTVSSGAGDNGGVSYGTHQLASKTGSMSAFLNSKEGSQFASQFQGMTPGSAEFNAKYKEIASTQGDAFDQAQNAYITRTHYAPQAAKLMNETGLDVSKRGQAVQEMVYSHGVQYGANSSRMVKALQGKDISKMSDSDIIQAVYDDKIANVGSDFKSSSGKVQASVADRFKREEQIALAMAAQQQGTSDATDPNTQLAQAGTSTSISPAAAGTIASVTDLSGGGNASVPTTGTSSSPAMMNTDSAKLISQQNDLRSQVAAGSAPAAPPSVASGGGGGKSAPPLQPRQNLDDYGIILTNKLLFD